MSMQKSPKPLSECNCDNTHEPCPFCGSTIGTIDLHGSITCLNCNQKIEGCCGGV